ncbi:MAG: hypothetical protein R3C99_08575 [Pirellulaceae bacterium]
MAPRPQPFATTSAPIIQTLAATKMRRQQPFGMGGSASMDDVVGAVNSGKVNDLHAKHRLATQQQISPA